MTAKRKSSVLDQPWLYGHISTPIIWGVGVLAGSGMFHSSNTPPSWVAVIFLAFTVVAPLVAVGIGSPLRSCWFVGALPAATGAYLTWTSYTTPWQRVALLPVALGVIVFGGWWHWIKSTTDKATRAQELAARKQAKLVERNQLLGWITAAGFKGVEAASDRIPFPDPTAGYEQVLTLPVDGSVTFKQLVANVERIEVAARAEHPIRFTPGKTAALVVGHVILRDVLADTIPYPIDRSPKSIHNPMPLGAQETGAVAVVTMRELAGLIGGTRGSGKSALLNSQLAHFVGCTDAVVWMIDGKGGRTARPWLQPFLEATTGRPALDWVATTPQEADWVLAAARAAIHVRSMGEGEKVIPSPSKPSIILIVEEASLVTGMGSSGNGSKRAKLAQEIVVLGRSEAVDAEFVVQRGTVTMLGSGDMKSQLQLRIGLGVESPDDAARLFPDTTMARELYRFAKDERYRGVFLMKAPGQKSVLPVKGYWLDPRDIPGLAMSLTPHRPDLDPETADYVHQALVDAECPGGYHGRWDRFRRDMGLAPSGDMSPVAVRDMSPAEGDVPGGTRRQSTAERLGLPESPFVAQILGRDNGTRDIETPQPVDVPRDPEKELADLEALWAAPAAEGEHVPVDEATQVVPPILLTLTQIFGALGADRLHTRRILEELPGGADPATRMTAKAFGRLMAHCGVAPLANDFQVDGERGRGYAVDDVLRAIHRARSGAKLNAAAFDWPDPQ